MKLNTMFKKNKIDIHQEPKQTIQINRPLIITLAITVTTVLLLAIIGAFTTTKPKQIKSQDIAKATIDKKSSVVSPDLENLPGSYSDSALKKYLPKSENGQFASLLQRLNALQREHFLLKQQLAKKDTTPKKPRRDPKTEQAKVSDLVFNNLGSEVDNMLAKQNKTKFGKKNDQPVLSKEQAKLIQQENEDAMKLAVLKGQDNPKDIYDLHNLIKPIAPKKQLSAGTPISATLISGINSTHRGTVIAQIRNDLYDTITGSNLLIPKGSKLLGDYSSIIRPGQRRILLKFNRIIRPDGYSILIGNGRNSPLGSDALGQAGIEGNVDNHWGRIIGASTISTILSVGAGVAADRNSGGKDYRDSRGNAMIGASNSMSKVGDRITNQALSIKPTITLPPGHQFSVILRKDMVVDKPYKSRR